MPLSRSEAARISAQRRLAAYQGRALNAEFNTVTFGVELECLIPAEFIRANGITPGGHGNGRPLPTPLFPSGWRVETDGSLSTEDPYAFRPLEIVSPVLTGMAGFQQLHDVIEKLQLAGVKVNSTCGFHVHIGLTSLMGERANDLDLVANLICRVMGLASRNELALIAISGKRSRLGNTYCQSLKPAFRSLRREDKWEDFRAVPGANDRYRTVNVRNVFQSNPGRRTIEFRVFGATVNPLKAVGLVGTVMALCVRAANSPLVRTPDWEATTLDGQTEESVLAAVASLQKEVRGGMSKEWRRVWLKDVTRNQAWNAKRLLRSND